MSNEAIVVEVVSVPGDIGVTPDLGRVALTNWGGDFSAIGVCNLQAGSVEVLQAGRKANLRHPALSPDGRTIAFTARGVDLSTEGLGSLHIAPTRGGEARRIGGRATYKNPSFSPDGSRILVFAGDKRWGPVQLVEIDLASGAETVLQFGAFEGSNKTAYDPVGQGYLVGERGPELFMPGRSGGIAPTGSFGGGVQVGAVNITVQNTGENLSPAAQKQIASQVQGIVMATLVNQKRSGGIL